MALTCGPPPGNEGERIVYESLCRQLDNSWMIYSSCRYTSVENVGVVDRELDLFLAHPRFGLFFVEVKKGIQQLDARGQWLQWNRERNQLVPTNAIEQVNRAKRAIFEYLRVNGAFSDNRVTSTTYVIFVGTARPDGAIGPRNGQIVFGPEIDHLYQRIERECKPSNVEMFTLERIRDVLFPRTTLKEHKAISLDQIYTEFEKSINQIPQILELLNENRTREEINIAISKLSEGIQDIQKVQALENALKMQEESVTEGQVTDLVRLMENLERNSVRSDAEGKGLNSELFSLRAEVEQIKEIAEAIGVSIAKNNEERLERANVDLASIENELQQINRSISEIKDGQESDSSARSFSSLQSQLGVVTAKLSQLSNVVGSKMIPIERLDMKLNRLAELNQAVSEQLETLTKAKGNSTDLVADLRNELRLIESRLKEMANRPLPSPIMVHQNGSRIPRFGFGPALATAVFLGALTLGAVVVAAVVESGSSDNSLATDASTSLVSASTPTPSSSADINVASSTTAQASITTVSTLAPTSSSSTSTSASSAPGTTFVSSSISVSPTPTVKAINSTSTSSSTVTTAPLMDIAVSQVAMGESHTCVLSTGGSVYCWGSNSAGQLGREPSSVSFSAAPVKINVPDARVTQISVGMNHTCALSATGTAYCWGFNYSGQLGIDSTMRYMAVPSAVVGGLKFSSVSAGAYSTCGLTAAGTAYCWGSNSTGQLGAKVGYSSLVPAEVIGGWTFEKISVGEVALTCGIESSGRILCWGNSSSTNGPVELNLYSETFSGSVMGIGAWHVCLIRESVNLRCYSNSSNDLVGVGSNSAGMGLSKGTLAEQLSVIALGLNETCGLTTAGKAYCWGSLPELVDTSKRFLSIDLYGSRKCGVTTEYQLLCWGKDADGKSKAGIVTSNPTLVALRGS